MSPKVTVFLLAFSWCLGLSQATADDAKPNIVLVMADDQGWGQVGYAGHPHLKTPHLDAMAASGLRFNRFYAAAPVCSPTRASVLTGRTPNRTGVPSHGWNLRLPEKTLPEALKAAGYTCGHFGKWHLNGIRGPGVPILGDDAFHPGRYGFDEWLSVTNYFDLDPLLSRKGRFEQFQGDSSNVIVDEALNFMASQHENNSPFLAVIWYGSPHNPQRAVEQDLPELPNDKLAAHLGEIVGIDRSIGTLRKGLRTLGIERETLVWYCSDNGGLEIDPDAVGSLRGHKGDLFEGGIRVPGIIEWPGHVQPGVTDVPASTMDIFPTLVDLLGLPEESMLSVHDGESIAALFDGKIPQRTHSIPFRFQRNAALIDGDHKLLGTSGRNGFRWQLYDLKVDPAETQDLSAKLPQRFARMKAEAAAMIRAVEASAAGEDYPAETVLAPSRRVFWKTMPEYKPHLEAIGGRSNSSRDKAKRQRTSPKDKPKSPKR